MRQVFVDNNSDNAVKEICRPYLDCDHVLIAVKYSFLLSGAAISYIEKTKENILLSEVPNKIKRVIKSVSKHVTDTNIYQNINTTNNTLRNQIENLGYSCSGKVVAVGKNVKNIQEGDLVACAGANFEKDADMLSVPQNLVAKINNEQFLKDASLTKIGAVALQGIRNANLQIGENICIIGMGVVGQLTLQLANLSSCNVVAIDITEERLSLAKELGAVETYLSTEENIVSEIEFLTNHQGVDCTIITASSKSDFLIQQAIKITRKKGKIIIVSDISLNIERGEFYKKEIELIVSASYNPEKPYCIDNCSCCDTNKDYPYEIIRWTENRNMQEFIKLIENKKLNLEKLITANVEINNIENAYNLLKNKTTLGIILDYPEKNKIKEPELRRSWATNRNVNYSQANNSQVSFKPAKKDILTVGMIGAGEFSKQHIFPIISQQENVKINSIADKSLSNLLNTSKIYGAQQCFNSYQEFFEKDSSEIVIISSEHKYHCAQALNAMENGKAVFLEKPMATNFQELETIKSFLDKNNETPFCVDYSRSFSPFIKKIKNEIINRHSPLIINYRMNVELLKKNNCAQEDMGAGRIIGEACSIIDIFYFLVNSKPISVSVEAINTANAQLFPTDNFCAQISFQDGSLCSLTYTSLGSQEIGRERMELFFETKSIVMEDYKILSGFGLKKSFNEYLPTPDKGRSALIRNFFNNLKTTKFTYPISTQRLYDVANLTLIIDKLACQNGGSEIIK